jgi:hypothetical protein
LNFWLDTPFTVTAPKAFSREPSWWVSSRIQFCASCSMKKPCTWNCWVGRDRNLASSWKSVSPTACIARAKVLLPFQASKSPSGVTSSRIASVAVVARCTLAAAGPATLQADPSVPPLKSSDTTSPAI